MRVSDFIEQDDLHAKLRVKIGLYRSYERDTTSGGGSTSGASSASSSGASTASTSDSGGSSTPTSNATGGHSHLIFEQNDPAVPSLDVTVAGYLARKSGGGNLKFNLDANSADVVDIYSRTASSDHAHTVTIGSHAHGIAHTHGIGHDHETPDHLHQLEYDIRQEGSLPGPVSVELDGQNIDSIIGGPFTATDGNDTFEVSLNDVLKTPGWKSLRFVAASGKGRITAYVIAKTLNLQ